MSGKRKNAVEAGTKNFHRAGFARFLPGHESTTSITGWYVGRLKGG